MKNLKILIKSFFLLRPRFLSTIFFIPILYGIGWALSQPLLLFNFEKENLSLIGTIITFLLFIILLPYWFYIKRNKSCLDTSWDNKRQILKKLCQFFTRYYICFSFNNSTSGTTITKKLYFLDR